MSSLRNIILSVALGAVICGVRAQDTAVEERVLILATETETAVVPPLPRACEARPDTSFMRFTRPFDSKGATISIYDLPYSLTLNSPDHKRVWINAAIFAGAFCGTLAVLECLPEGATNWNRASIQSTPWYRRWYRNVIEKGPEWDGDSPIFNYVMHPYAGAVYFMAARSAGLNFYRSLLFCSLVSTVGWEFGIEGTMERPSIQDIFITPLVGSCFGELFYILKRHIVSHGYTLFGSPVLGHAVAFVIDPVNEVVGWFGGDGARKAANRHKMSSSLMPAVGKGSFGLTLTCVF